ncbi:SEC-C metal-binding domain-containing protein [Hyphomonas pacifica]|uniref:Preprotein translocase subunit SecA n=1 Tax=Hyphomonas pacifica TaxID=1280941 RepID=A0A062U7Z5_9PROT|nr:SEC-C metal-binding domain-containing protein [Hyphomonas pacifica]KCZ52265.1 hypothetical protein HY2_08620 [Hyphomonas pacifica]RAN31412.1 hypothetical protein HY3_16750 [Hyphomonas pacifica]
MKRRKRKKARRARPDEVFGNEALTVARFGKDVVWQSHLTAEQLAELQAKQAEAFDAVVAEIDSLVIGIATQVSQLPASQLLHRAWWELAARHMGVNAEADVGPEDALAMRMVDYIQSIIASVPPAPVVKPEVTEEDWNQLRESVDALFMKLNTSYQICRTAKALKEDPALDLKFEEFFFKAQMYWCNVRGERYQVLEEAHLRDLFAPHSDVMEEMFGISADTFVDEIMKIVASLTKGIQIAFEEMESFRQDSLNAVTTKVQTGQYGNKTFEEIFENVIAENNWGDRRERVGSLWIGLDLYDVRKLTILSNDLVDELTWGPGEDTDFFANGPFPGWPLRVWPTFKRPFICIDGRACCFDLHSLCDNIYRIMSRVIRRKKPDYQETWNVRQQAVAEELPLAQLAALLPGSTVFKSAYYKWIPKPGHTKKEWCETDGLVVYDDHLFIVESKGGAFTHTPPATDFEAYISSLKTLLLRPATQGQRFLEYLNSAESVELYDADHNAIGLLCRTDFRQVTICTVTLDPFTEMAAQAQHLGRLGINVGSRAIWPISVDDLRVYSNVFSSPLEFLHYVEQRNAAFASELLELDDELDHLGLYLKHNRYADYAQERFADAGATINFSGYHSAIDKFFSERLHDPTFPCPLRQDAPERFIEILEILAGSDRKGRSRLASYLLDLSGDGRKDISECIDRELREQLGRGRPLAFSTVGGLDIGNTTLVYVGDDAIRNAKVSVRLAREHMLIAGERERLLLELTYADNQLRDVDWQWVRMEDISSEELPELQAGAEKLRQIRLTTDKKTRRKIGRNDLCPCGSGKKYKKCCLRL